MDKRQRQSEFVDCEMPGTPNLRRPSTGEFQEHDSITEVSEDSSPDILQVFQDDQSATNSAMQLDSLSNKPHQEVGSSFPQFPRLPLELRYLVWEAAIPEPAIVPRSWNSTFGYTLQRSVPSVLQACSESRRLLIAPARSSHAASSPKYQLVQRHGRNDEGVYLNWRAESMWIYRGCKCVPCRSKLVS